MHHTLKGVPQLPAGHVGVQIQSDHAAQIVVGDKVEVQHIGKGRKHIKERCAVEDQRNGDLFVTVESDEVIVESGGIGSGTAGNDLCLGDRFLFQLLDLIGAYRMRIGSLGIHLFFKHLLFFVHMRNDIFPPQKLKTILFRSVFIKLIIFA